MAVMTQQSARTCPDCGKALPPAAPEGLCPSCLALTAMLGDSPRPDRPPSDQTPDDTGLRFFGDYELLEEIARGGMGIVYRARQLGVNRPVALKLLSGGAAAGRDFVHRFHTEAAAAARLDHPHIVPIYEFGEHEGAHFLAMKFLEGGTLADRLRKGPLPDREAARLLLAITDAIRHAHQHGVLHRDLKPGNILLDAEGRPCVADFGLARLTDDDSSLTLSHAMLGTVAYLAPEVAGGGAAQATTAADVYGLGAVLYEMLAGRPPFREATLAETVRAVQEREPVRVNQLNPSVSRDLATICHKCLEKDPARRYASTEELAEDLQHFLNDEPIQARPASRTERVLRWCRRKPAMAAPLATIALLLLVLIIGSPIAAYRINEARQAARQEARRARENLYFAEMQLANRAIEDNNTGHALKLLEQHVPAEATGEDSRGWEWYHLWNQVRPDPSVTLGSHETEIASTAFSPTGELVASCDFAGNLQVWEFTAGSRLYHREMGTINEVLFYSEDILMVADHSGNLTFHDVTQGAVLRSFDLGAPVWAIALSPGRDQFAALTGSDDVPAKTTIWTLSPPSPEQPVVALSPA